MSQLSSTLGVGSDTGYLSSLNQSALLWYAEPQSQMRFCRCARPLSQRAPVTWKNFCMLWQTWFAVPLQKHVSAFKDKADDYSILLMSTLPMKRPEPTFPCTSAPSPIWRWSSKRGPKYILQFKNKDQWFPVTAKYFTKKLKNALHKYYRLWINTHFMYFRVFIAAARCEWYWLKINCILCVHHTAMEHFTQWSCEAHWCVFNSSWTTMELYNTEEWTIYSVLATRAILDVGFDLDMGSVDKKKYRISNPFACNSR